MSFSPTYSLARILLPIALWLTNMVATSFIAWKTWRFYQAVKYTPAENSTRIKHFTQTLLLMAETGFLYSFLWIVVLLDITGKFSLEVNYFLLNIIPHITGLYPCLLVLLIIFKKRSYDGVDSTVCSTGPYISQSDFEA
jgi:hypothetical protein